MVYGVPLVFDRLLDNFSSCDSAALGLAGKPLYFQSVFHTFLRAPAQELGSLGSSCIICNVHSLACSLVSWCSQDNDGLS